MRDDYIPLSSRPTLSSCTVAEVARRLRTTDVVVRALIRDGELPATKMGGRWWVEATEVPRLQVKLIRACEPL